MIFDRTIGSLTTRPTTGKVGKKSVPRLDIGFRLARTARVTVRIRSTLRARRSPPSRAGGAWRPGRRSSPGTAWSGARSLSGTVQVTAESRTSYGTSGLVRSVTLKAPPKPKKASPKKP